jgi:hypothetical protein
MRRCPHSADWPSGDHVLRYPPAPLESVTPALSDREICLCAGIPDQLALFEIDAPAIPITWTWPEVTTDHTRRPGFWRLRTPDVFADRAAVGPLLIFPDTNVLITMYGNLDAIEHVGWLSGPHVEDSWEDEIDALRDLLQLWWWRDVRFCAGRWHLDDFRKPPPPPRRAALARAVDCFAQDYFMRGGNRTVLPEGVRPGEARCPLHPEREIATQPTMPPPARLPRAQLDRKMVQAALDEGSHVFLTSDRKVLALHPRLMERGLAILTPRQLLEQLAASGELEPVHAELVPDLAALSAFYGLRSVDDFAPDGTELGDWQSDATQTSGPSR